MQQPAPELPPMPPPSSSPQPERFAQPMQPVAHRGMPLTHRLRQAVTILTSAGLTLAVLVIFFQLVARPGLRPSDIVATIEAQTEMGIFNQKMGAQPGQMVMTEAQYKEQLAEAERSGQAKAELSFQKDLAVVQADKEKVVQAYASLYQRANIIAQAAIQLETIAQQFRQQLLQMSNGGRSMVIGVKDLFCGLGSPEACSSAHADRESMISEADELSRGDVGNRVRELMSGIDDPATFITHDDRRRRPTFGMADQP